MKFRKVLSIVTIAAVFLLAPAVIPFPHKAAPLTQVASLAGCVNVTSQPADAAFAIPLLPCPVQGSVPSPWWAFGPMLGAASVIANAAIVSNNQCRELTRNEAVTSFLLPFIGMLFNENNPRCGIHRRH